MFHTIPSMPVPARVTPALIACIGPSPRVLRPSGALLRRDAAALNHDLSTVETIPCGTAGSVLRHLAAHLPDPSDRHESRLHKLGIKVKIAAIGGRLRNGAAVNLTLRI